jgi:hypothetical protein
MRRFPTAALAVALLLAGCSGLGPQPTPAPPTPTPGPQQIAQQAAAAMAEVRTAHFKLDFEGQPPPTALGFQLTSAEGDTAAPDKLKAKLKARFGPNPIESELVVLGSDKLLKNPLSGRFEALTLPLGSLALLDKDRGVPLLLRNAKDPALAGRENVDGAEADVLTGTLAAADLAPLVTGLPPVAQPVKAKAWIGSSDRLVRRVRLEGPISAGEPAAIVRILTLSAFNQDVTIQRPT